MEKAGIAVTIKLYEAVIRKNEPVFSNSALIAFDPVPAFILDSPRGSNHTKLLIFPGGNLASLVAAARSRDLCLIILLGLKFLLAWRKQGPAALSVAGLHQKSSFREVCLCGKYRGG